jgi:hypothetical protein
MHSAKQCIDKKDFVKAQDFLLQGTPLPYCTAITYSVSVLNTTNDDEGDTLPFVIAAILIFH